MTCSNQIKSAARKFLSINCVLLGLMMVVGGCRGDGQENRPRSVFAGSNATFYVENIRAQQTVVKGFNSWGYANQKEISLVACPKDVGLLSVIVGQDFIIKSENGETRQLTTDASGCLRWTEEYTYRTFDPEAFLYVIRTITGTGTHRGSIQIEFAINLWTDQVVDLRFDSVPVLARSKTPLGFKAGVQTAQANRRSRLDLRSITMESLGIPVDQWSIDSQLRLNVVHQYRARLTPTVLRPSLRIPFTNETPIQGQVRLTMVLLRDLNQTEIRPEHYVTHVVKTLALQQGGTVEDLSLNFNDTVSDSASRMRAVIKLEAILDEGSIDPILLEAPVGPLPTKASMQLVPSKLDAQDLIKNVMAHQQRVASQQRRPLDLFREASRFRQLDAASWNSRMVNDISRNFGFQQLQNVIANGQVAETEKMMFYVRLCHEIFGSAAAAQRSMPPQRFRGRTYPHIDAALPVTLALSKCLRQPQEMLAVEFRGLVDGQKPPVIRGRGSWVQESLTIQSSVAITDTESSTQGENRRRMRAVNGEIGFSPSLDILKVFGFPIRLGGGVRFGFSREWYRAYASSIETRKTNSVTANVSRSIFTVAYAFDIETEARRCLMVGVRESVEGMAGNGVYLCQDKAQKMLSREAYYLLNQTGGSASPVFDPDSALEMPWRMLIRGAHVYQEFKRTVGNARIDLQLEPIPDEAQLVSNQNPNSSRLQKAMSEVYANSRMTQDFPGLLSPQSLR